MSGITHVEDLSVQQICELLELNWTASEKFDGSFFEFGLDAEGRYFGRRKNAPPCHALSDWPQECWAGTYQIAHTLGQMVVESLQKEGLIQWGNVLQCELIHGARPNTIRYQPDAKLTGTMIITGSNFTRLPAHDEILGRFRATWPQAVRKSLDGREITEVQSDHNWRVCVNEVMPVALVKARLSRTVSQMRTFLDSWFVCDSKIPNFTILEVLETNLSKRHPRYRGDMWTAFRAQLKEEREALMKTWHAMVMMLKDTFLRVLINENRRFMGAGSFCEGYVIQASNFTCKVVDRDQFAPANLRTNWVRYMLIGGRRPRRSSFLSRTKDWTKADRLARMDVLLNRYLANHAYTSWAMPMNNNSMSVGYFGENHQRTLNLFADTRKRIEDGR